MFFQWLRIKYEEQRQRAYEQALEQGLLFRADEANGAFPFGPDNSSDDEDTATTATATMAMNLNTPNSYGAGSSNNTNARGVRFSDDEDDQSTQGTSSADNMSPTSPLATFDSGGSRAWEEAGIDAETRRYGAKHAQSPRASASAGVGSGANKKREGAAAGGQGLAPLPLHKLNSPAGTPVHIKRREKRRAQFANNNSKFHNSFVDVASVQLASNAAQPEVCVARMHACACGTLSCLCVWILCVSVWSDFYGMVN